MFLSKRIQANGERIRANIWLVIVVAAVFMNLIGIWGPELGFDALWYHLTEAKLYFLHGGIYHIAGGLIYYSEMPRLGEIMFLGLLGRLGELGAHLISFSAGVGAAMVTYFIARKWLEKRWALLAVVIFYVTPLVGWLSGSGYVDLVRTFFEGLAFYFLISKRSVLTGVAIGLAISTKTLSLGSLGILGVLSLLSLGPKRTIWLILTAVVVAIPWFISAYLNTGFLFYPIGAGILDERHMLVGMRVLSVLGDFWKLWLAAEDPISPAYLLAVPFAVWGWRKLPKALIGYVVLSYLVWWVTPRTGGGRFILPYLPVWAVLTVMIIREIREIRVLGDWVIGAVIVAAVVNLGYRGVAMWKLRDYLIGRESKTEYLCRNLDFKTAVFVDCDDWMEKNIRSNNLVYVSGVHNLYYADFPFVHESWWRGEEVDYLLTQNETKGVSSEMKARIMDKGNWEWVYDNSHTGVTIYKKI